MPVSNGIRGDKVVAPVQVGRYLSVPMAATVAASSAVTLTYPVEFPCTITQLRFRVYLGNQLSMQVVPSLNHNNSLQPLMRFPSGSKQYLEGDDENDVYRLSQRAEPGDVITVTATNTNASNAYDFSCTFELLREG